MTKYIIKDSKPRWVTWTHETGALAYYHKPSREWWYIPTEPEGRKWRGPYRGHSDMVDGVHAELGSVVYIVITTVSPQFLLAKSPQAGLQDAGITKEAGQP